MSPGSVSLMPEAVYTRVDNLELRLRATFLSGSPRSEFGEKAWERRVDFRARYQF